MYNRKKGWMRKMLGVSLLLGCVMLGGCGKNGEIQEQDPLAGGSGQQEITTEDNQPARGEDEPGGNGMDRGTKEEPVYTAMNLTKTVAASEDSSENPDETFIDGTTRFSVKLLQKVAERADSNANYMISPTSIQMALAMASNGADNNTKTELERLLCGEFYEEGDIVRCGTLEMHIEDLNLYLNAYVKQLADSEDVVFENANAVWMHNNKEMFSVKEDFLKRISGFSAECFEAPFDESTVTDINNWVNYHTREMIPSLLNEIPEDVVMYLINAIAFEGEWEEPFEEHQIDDTFTFHCADGIEQTVTGMRSEENIYLESDYAKGFVKYYKGGKFGFAALLPEEGMTPEEYISGLSPDDFTELFKGKTYDTVNVEIPKFSSDYDTELSKVLEALGVKEAFTPAADFSQMADTDTGLLYINRVLHKTHIEVDEKGTKAAAVTAVEMTKNDCVAPSEPKTVILDRPFVYAIMDMETNLPIFIGVQNSIE
ncbi:MAG: serpin family protein [Lachnospiraceae bacterium]|nr:serpin family protein [Lachnospiraceae bacterium]